MKRRMVYATVLLLTFSQFACRQKRKEATSADANVETECLEQPQSQNGEGESKTVLHALRFHTPEQLTRSLERSFGIKLKDGSQDAITGRLNLVLGGVDHLIQDRRDPTSKAQTILAAQHVAWLVAREVVAKEIDLSPEDRLVLKFADLGVLPERSDGPWRDQVERLFWIAFARAPTENDLALSWTTFHEMAADQEPEAGSRAAWTGLIYALLASEEFWFA